jgi:uncharacterized membrane protein YgdD (TMEM256/DUF423 family)
MASFPRDKLWLLCGAILGLASVALGAFGAHGLELHFERLGYTGQSLDEKTAPWETAAQYQMCHALALLGVGLLTARRCGLAINLAGTTMTLGTLLFSGCLYFLVLGGPQWLGAVVPIGGSLLILGWACLAVAIVRLTDRAPS